MNNGTPLILCVDDDPDFLASMKLIIESHRYSVTTATSAEEGLACYKNCRPDLVLVDLMMEEVDSGVNLVKEMRALGDAPPIYMLSSVGDGLTQSTDYSALGLAGVLQKPITPQTLLTALTAKLGG